MQEIERMNATLEARMAEECGSMHAAAAGADDIPSSASDAGTPPQTG